MSKDMSGPNWARTYPRLQRNIAELREHGCEVTEPSDFDKPPARRSVAIKGKRPL
jgi:hypothetical protein